MRVEEEGHWQAGVLVEEEGQGTRRCALRGKARGLCVEEEGQGECVEEEGQGGTWGGMCHTPPQSRPKKAKPAISVHLSSFICVFDLKL